VGFAISIYRYHYKHGAAGDLFESCKSVFSSPPLLTLRSNTDGSLLSTTNSLLPLLSPASIRAPLGSRFYFPPRRFAPSPPSRTLDSPCSSSSKSSPATDLTPDGFLLNKNVIFPRFCSSSLSRPFRDPSGRRAVYFFSACTTYAPVFRHGLFKSCPPKDPDPFCDPPFHNLSPTLRNFFPSEDPRKSD